MDDGSIGPMQGSALDWVVTIGGVLIATAIVITLCRHFWKYGNIKNSVLLVGLACVALISATGNQLVFRAPGLSVQVAELSKQIDEILNIEESIENQLLQLSVSNAEVIEIAREISNGDLMPRSSQEEIESIIQRELQSFVEEISRRREIFVVFDENRTPGTPLPADNTPPITDSNGISFSRWGYSAGEAPGFNWRYLDAARAINVSSRLDFMPTQRIRVQDGEVTIIGTDEVVAAPVAEAIELLEAIQDGQL